MLESLILWEKKKIIGLQVDQSFTNWWAGFRSKADKSGLEIKSYVPLLRWVLSIATYYNSQLFGEQENKNMSFLDCAEKDPLVCFPQVCQLLSWNSRILSGWRSGQGWFLVYCYLPKGKSKFHFVTDEFYLPSEKYNLKYLALFFCYNP